MKHVASFAPVARYHPDALDHAVICLEDGSLPALADALASLAEAGITTESTIAQQVVTDALCGILSAFDADNRSTEAYAALAAFCAAHAAFAYELLLLSRFPEGSGDTATLDDATVLCLVALMAAGGAADDALALLSAEIAQRATPAFLRAAWTARCRILGHDGTPATLWPTALAPCADPQEAIAARPLAIDAHRALGRGLAEDGCMAEALAAFATGLSLPIGRSEKGGIAADFATLAVILASQGDAALLGERRVRLALGANAGTVVDMLSALETAPVRALADPHVRDAVVASLRDFAAPTRELVSPYPLRDGRPHVNMIFLEITNYCNQKCTFCPDMHREDARTWLPLQQVKDLIDQIASTMSANMLQLNAYGEPLLHPNIDEILAYIREKRMPWPTFFTTHGMTLVDKKLKQLSHNYPSAIAVSLHNDSQESYEATRSAKIGDYATLVARVSALMRQMAHEGAEAHLRMYQMISNGHEDMRVDPKVRGAFPDSPERMTAHIRKWEALAVQIAADAPPEVEARALFNTDADIADAFHNAVDDCGVPLPVLQWRDKGGHIQQAFLSGRPVETYANLLLEYHPDWTVERSIVNQETCRFLPEPSLTIFATGQLGLCCLDLNNTANFGRLSDYDSLVDAMNSPQARQMFAELSNGIAVSRGCQICLSTGTKMCAS